MTRTQQKRLQRKLREGGAIGAFVDIVLSVRERFLAMPPLLAEELGLNIQQEQILTERIEEALLECWPFEAGKGLEYPKGGDVNGETES